MEVSTSREMKFFLNRSVLPIADLMTLFNFDVGTLEENP